MSDFDDLEIPAFLRRDKDEKQPPAPLNPRPVVEHKPEIAKAEVMRKERKRIKTKSRIGRMKARSADRAALAAGKHWDSQRARWV